MFYSEILADFVINFKEIPNNAKQRAKELMLDCVGVAYAGFQNEAITKTINANDEVGSVMIWGTGKTTSPLNAAMINAMSSHVLDFDDTLTEAILHASAILSPLCLSYGFSKTNDGEKILKAFIMGWEVAGRIGIASKGTFHKRGFHTSSIAGVFASTVAVCVINDLNVEQTINALGFAASFAGGVNEFLSNASNSKILHIASAILNGVRACEYAKSGLFAPVSIFEGRDNIFRCFGIFDECDLDLLTKDLGKKFMVNEVSIKPYPSCHFAHGLIECAKLLRNDGFKASDIEKIICYVDSVPASFICEPLNVKLNPKSTYDAKFSFAFLMSFMFIDGEITLQTLDNLNRSEIIEFAQKFTYEIYKSSGFPKYFCGKIKAILKDKTIIEKEVKINKGNPDNPLSLDELLAKFYANMGDVALANHIKNQILNIEKIKEIAL